MQRFSAVRCPDLLFLSTLMSKGLLTLLTASHSVMCSSADFESSTQLNSCAVMRHHMPHHIHVDGINGSTALHRLVMCENVLWCVTLSKVSTGLNPLLACHRFETLIT